MVLFDFFLRFFVSDLLVTKPAFYFQNAVKNSTLNFRKSALKAKILRQKIFYSDKIELSQNFVCQKVSHRCLPSLVRTWKSLRTVRRWARTVSWARWRMRLGLEARAAPARPSRRRAPRPPTAPAPPAHKLSQFSLPQASKMLIW